MTMNAFQNYGWSQTMTSNSTSITHSLNIKQQSGYVLIQILLIFALVSTIMAHLLYGQEVALERSERLADELQHQEWLLAGETTLLAMMKNNDALQYGEDLALVEETDPANLFYSYDDVRDPDAPAATIVFKVDDLSGRFNLNWLYQHEDNPNAAQYKEAFERLLGHEDVSVNSSLASELYDFIDSENNTADNTYRSLETPYLSSQNQLAHTSELLLLKSMTLEDYKKLLPVVTVANFDQPLNVLMAKSAVIQSLHPEFNEEIIENIRSAAEKEDFNILLEDELMSELKPSIGEDGLNILPVLASVSSMFEGLVTVQLETRVMHLKSILYKNDNGKMRVLNRTFSDN
jgi:general secretion pathway protein K